MNIPANNDAIRIMQLTAAIEFWSKQRSHQPGVYVDAVIRSLEKEVVFAHCCMLERLKIPDNKQQGWKTHTHLRK
jgi:hypothetical protein